MKYHDAQDALDIGMNVIDCGHFETEDIFKDAISIYLEDIEGIEVIKSNVKLPKKIVVFIKVWIHISQLKENNNFIYNKLESVEVRYV